MLIKQYRYVKLKDFPTIVDIALPFSFIYQLLNTDIKSRLSNAIVCDEFNQSSYHKYRLIHCISSYFGSKIWKIFSNYDGILL